MGEAGYKEAGAGHGVDEGRVNNWRRAVCVVGTQEEKGLGGVRSCLFQPCSSSQALESCLDMKQMGSLVMKVPHGSLGKGLLPFCTCSWQVKDLGISLSAQSPQRLAVLYPPCQSDPRSHHRSREQPQ